MHACYFLHTRAPPAPAAAAASPHSVFDMKDGHAWDPKPHATHTRDPSEPETNVNTHMIDTRMIRGPETRMCVNRHTRVSPGARGPRHTRAKFQETRVWSLRHACAPRAVRPETPDPRDTHL